MHQPIVRGLIRARPTRTYEKYLRHALKPSPGPEQIAWGQAAAKYLMHRANLRPDAYVRLSELMSTNFVPLAEPSQIVDWVRNDHPGRFELRTEFDKVEGQQDRCKTMYIRARWGHSRPGVDITTVRIRHPNLIPSLAYATTPENWPAIEKYGLRPEIPSLHKPRRSNPNFIYFAQDLAALIPHHFTTYPAKNNAPDNHLVQLQISINVTAAMSAGIKFFRNRHGQIISTGLKDGGIPSSMFDEVFVVVVQREMLFNAKDEKGELANT